MSHGNEQPRTGQPDRIHVERREEKSGGNTVLALIVGGLVVAVGVLVWALYGGGYVADAPAGDDIDISVEGAADGGAGTAEDARDGTAAAPEGGAEPASERTGD